MDAIDRDLYYMTPIANVGSILRHGILSFNNVRSDPAVASRSQSIADPNVNARRSVRSVDGRSLHDFVPLYWATHTPMQYVRTVSPGGFSQEELIFFAFAARDLLVLPGILTCDGNAASNDTTFYDGAGALPFIDWRVVDTRNCYSSEYKRLKCAEVLVPDRIERRLIRAIFCSTVSSRDAINKLLSERRSQFTIALLNASAVRIARHLYYL